MERSSTTSGYSMSRRTPTLNELRAMAQGARIGAMLAAGPHRWPSIRRFIRDAAIVALVGLTALGATLIDLWR